MAAKKPSPQFDFIVEQLQKNNSITYAEISAAAQKKGLTIFPIMYGRAQAMLGLVTSAKRGAGKAAPGSLAASPQTPLPLQARTEARAPKPAARPTAPAAVGIDSIIAHVKAGNRNGSATASRSTRSG